MAAPRNPFRVVRDLFGVLAVVLALAAQVAPGMVVPDADPGRNATLLQAAMVLCGDDGTPGPSAPQPSHHHRHDAALCPLCLGLTPPAPLLAGTPVLPPPRGASFARAALPPPARAPPPRAVGAALPRGPPVSA